MRKGIIMEIDERFLTMLTPEGEFLRAKKQDLYYEIGQEIYFSPFQEAEKKKMWSFSIFNGLKGKSFAAMAMAVALVLAIVSFIPFNNQNQVYAYMSIDVNPSIELGVNDQLQVIELTAYNDSGNAVIETIENWEKKSLHEVTEQILLVIKNKGYLVDQKDVVIGTVHTGKIIEANEEKLDQSIKKLEETIKQDEAKIIPVEATEKERELAKKSGVTVGQFVKEKTEKGKIDASQSEGKQLQRQQKNNNKNQEKVEYKNSKIEKHPSKNMSPGQQKKLNNQKKINQDKQKQKNNNVAPGKNKEEKHNKKNINKNREKDSNNGNNKGQKESKQGKNNNKENNRNNGKNDKSENDRNNGKNDKSENNRNNGKNNNSENDRNSGKNNHGEKDRNNGQKEQKDGKNNNQDKKKNNQNKKNPSSHNHDGNKGNKKEESHSDKW